MRDLLVNGALQLYGAVGITWDEGFSVSDVAAALAEHGEGDLTVRINSGGGIATDGMAIYSLLKTHPGEITMIVDGVAASAASLIAMAGDKRQMMDGAMLMIHDPATITLGNAAEHEKTVAFCTSSPTIMPASMPARPR
jgi:ATP-dependent protease ClpP protease subunit